MWWSDGFGSNGFMPWLYFGPVMMLIVLAVGIAACYLMMRAAGGAHRSGEGRAAEILRERFARGEIDQREFEERRRTLSGPLG